MPRIKNPEQPWTAREQREMLLIAEAAPKRQVVARIMEAMPYRTFRSIRNKLARLRRQQ